MKKIHKITETVVLAMNRGDIRSLFSVLSDDAVLFPPNEPPKTGAVLHTWFSQFLNNFTVHFDSYRDEEIVKLITIMRHQNGKVVEECQEDDQLGFARQLGMELKPKETEK